MNNIPELQNMSFPNFRKKHAEDSLYSPRDFMEYLKRTHQYPKFDPPKGVIFCYDRRLLKHISDEHRIKEVDFYGQMYLLSEFQDQVAVLGQFGAGAPVTAMVMEELIAFGVEAFISIGTAGTLQKSLQIGDLVLCEKAIRDEGTSHHYLGPSKYVYASKEMIEKIKRSLDKIGQKYIVGTTWTIYAPYRETVAEIEQYRKEGVATVEMEAAALFVVAQHRSVEAGALFTISDSLAELTWNPQFNHENTRKGLETLFKVSLDALSTC